MSTTMSILNSKIADQFMMKTIINIFER